MKRSIRGLLVQLRAHINSTGKVWGLCSSVGTMLWDEKITGEEADMLYDYIKTNTDKWWRIQYNSLGEIIRPKSNQFVWKPGHLKPRLKWLDKHINKTNIPKEQRY